MATIEISVIVKEAHQVEEGDKSIGELVDMLMKDYAINGRFVKELAVHVEEREWETYVSKVATAVATTGEEYPKRSLRK